MCVINKSAHISVVTM